MSESSGLKRKRSPSISAPPAVKAGKAGANSQASNTSPVQVQVQVQINYLARQCTDDLPLINKADTIPNIVNVLSSYSHVLDRHESLASNLGARPLAPILIKRFERCFDAPPDIIASHSHARSESDSSLPQVSWLDVVHFARAHPHQFALSTFSEGRHVCQFYYPQKQVRVQVSEEDYLFIKSGRCQDLIPPLPIWEDEEKEVGTCEILEKTLKDLTNAADMVAARTRQLSHRLKGRRMAILGRRAGEEEGGAHVNEHVPQPTQPAPPPTFVAVNAQPHPLPNGTVNGTTAHKPDHAIASTAIRADLLRHFQSLPHNQTTTKSDLRRPSMAPSASSSVQHAPTTHTVTDAEPGSSNSVSPAPAPYPHPDNLSYYISDDLPTPLPNSRPAATPSHSSASKHNFARPLPPGTEHAQPYRAICQAQMESLPRGARMLPPCDRCRRLRMDCLRNLTSCGGCTKKHARCHWREVTRAEISGFEDVDDAVMKGGSGTARPSATAVGSRPPSMSAPVTAAPVPDASDVVPRVSLASHGAGSSEADESDSASAHYVDDEDDDDDDEDDSTPLDDLEALLVDRAIGDESAVLIEARHGADGHDAPVPLMQRPREDTSYASDEHKANGAGHLARSVLASSPTFASTPAPAPVPILTTAGAPPSASAATGSTGLAGAGTSRPLHISAGPSRDGHGGATHAPPPPPPPPTPFSERDGAKPVPASSWRADSSGLGAGVDGGRDRVVWGFRPADGTAGAVNGASGANGSFVAANGSASAGAAAVAVTEA